MLCRITGLMIALIATQSLLLFDNVSSFQPLPYIQHLPATALKALGGSDYLSGLNSQKSPQQSPPPPPPQQQQQALAKGPSSPTDYLSNLSSSSSSSNTAASSRSQPSPPPPPPASNPFGGGYLSNLSPKPPTQSNAVPAVKTTTAPPPPKQSSPPSDYLSGLSPPKPRPASGSLVAPTHGTAASDIDFYFAERSHFDVDNLNPKGPRKNADRGTPHDSTRQLVEIGPTAVGSWWCKWGGWPSPALRATTEVFYVFSGHGCLSDLDGVKHFFGTGDTVILPKGWSGRWDVLEDVHKVWLVHDHPKIEERDNPIRAVVVPYNELTPPQFLTPRSLKPKTASQTIYNVGPTEVGSSMCEPGTYTLANIERLEFFHVLEGKFYLTNTQGHARRCVAGDTVVLPKGWSGIMDVIEPVRQLSVAVRDVSRSGRFASLPLR